MVNAVHAEAYFRTRMPHDMLPETTEGRVGFVHPYIGTADVAESTIKVLLRDFDLSGLEAKERLLRELAADAEARFPGTRVSMTVKENYRNMKEVLSKHPELTRNAMEAARRAGLEPYIEPIRGGTDGSKLTFRRLPRPNIFTDGHALHGKLDFNSR